MRGAAFCKCASLMWGFPLSQTLGQFVIGFLVATASLPLGRDGREGEYSVVSCYERKKIETEHFCSVPIRRMLSAL